nr:hypothetical protein [Planctomycetota bacterium]
MSMRYQWLTVLAVCPFGLDLALTSNHSHLFAAQPNAQQVLDSGIRLEDVGGRPYLDYVRECVDLLIQHGTDRYGSVRSPMLMNILDVRTRECPADPLELDESFRVTRRGRRGPSGGHPYAELPAISSRVRPSPAGGADCFKHVAP